MLDTRTICISHRALAVITIIVLLSVVGCSGDDEVTGIADSGAVLTDASAKVNGESINGQTFSVGQNVDGDVRFEACLLDSPGNPLQDHHVRVEYVTPGMGMMHRRGSFVLHDDGTHGDLIPHDGIYCYEDSSGAYGCHGSDARPGDYHYDFCGVGPDGQESNHIDVKVVLAP